MSYPIPFGKSHHLDCSVDFRYLNIEQQQHALAEGWSPAISYLSATGFGGDCSQTCSTIAHSPSAYSSVYSIVNTSHDGTGTSKVFTGN